MDRGVILCPSLSPHVSRNLQDIPDENQNSLDDEFVVLQSLVPVLLEKSAESVGEDSPELLVNEALFVILSVSLDLEIK